MLGLGCFIPLASPLADQAKRTISILALDGISWTANVFTDSPVYDFADRDLPYLEPAFREAWGDFARIQTIPWNGDISDTEETLALIKAYLPALARNAKTKSRIFVVVGHSWGTLLAYRAIKELSAEGMIEAGDIDQLITLGSPLMSQVPLIKGKFEKYGAWKGIKPVTDVVREWRNYVIEEDLVATVIVDLNESDNGENIILPLHTGVIPNKIYAHRQYHENQLFLDTIGLHIRNSTQNNSKPVAQNTTSTLVAPEPELAPKAAKPEPPLPEVSAAPVVDKYCLASPTPDCLIGAALNIAGTLEDSSARDNIHLEIALAQAKAGLSTEALETMESTANIDFRVSAFAEIAETQGKAGYALAAHRSLDVALETAEVIERAKSRASALRDVAVAQATVGDHAAAEETFGVALKTARSVGNIRALEIARIAMAQAESGFHAAAKETFMVAIKVAMTFPTAFRFAELRDVAVAQATVGDHAAADVTFEAAFKVAQTYDDANWRTTSIQEIRVNQATVKAVAQAKAGAFAQALDIGLLPVVAVLVGT